MNALVSGVTGRPPELVHIRPGEASSTEDFRCDLESFFSKLCTTAGRRQLLLQDSLRQPNSSGWLQARAARSGTALPVSLTVSGSVQAEDRGLRDKGTAIWLRGNHFALRPGCLQELARVLGREGRTSLVYNRQTLVDTATLMGLQAAAAAAGRSVTGI